MADRIQLKRGTAAQATSANEILAAGELGLETDTGKIKVGNGTTAWNSLPYIWEPTVPTTGISLIKYASGYYNNGYTNNSVEPTIAADEQVYVPILPVLYSNANVNLKKMRVLQVGGGSSVQLRFAIYERIADGTLSLVVDGGFVTMTGLTYAELTFNQTLTKGKLYYASLKHNADFGTVTQLKGINGSVEGPIGIHSDDMSTINQGLRKTGISTGTFPSTDTLPTTASTTKASVMINFELETL
jgi:hypothetical protein